MNNYIFNFSASYTGGGLKRLNAYSEWFDKKGGANFIVHDNLKGIGKKFINNRYYYIKKNNAKRLLNDCYYLKEIMSDFNTIDLYFSYGIPIYEKIARINWFHLSNVLPLLPHYRFMSLPLKLKFHLLGNRIKKNFRNYNIISAESRYSLNLLKEKIGHDVNGIVLNNGHEDMLMNNAGTNNKNVPYAVAVGTYKYKALKDTFRLFLNLKKKDNNLVLVIMGPEHDIPKEFYGRKDIEITGEVKRDEVIENLRKAKYFISTSLVENSSNATLEGLLCSGESYISDIPPHRELLQNCTYQTLKFDNVSMPVLHVEGNEKNKISPVSWDEIIKNMIKTTENMLNKTL